MASILGSISVAEEERKGQKGPTGVTAMYRHRRGFHGFRMFEVKALDSEEPINSKIETRYRRDPFIRTVVRFER
jgi:hypothetical protein